MRLKLSLLGLDVIDLTIETSSSDTEDSNPSGISGGSGHNFERSYQDDVDEDGDSTTFGFTTDRRC